MNKIRQQFAKQPIKRLKNGERVTLPRGQVSVVGANEVGEDRAVLLPEGAPLPTRLRKVSGHWKVSAEPIIAARKAAEAARQKAQSSESAAESLRFSPAARATPATSFLHPARRPAGAPIAEEVLRNMPSNRLTEILSSLDPANPRYATDVVDRVLAAAQEAGASDAHFQPGADGLNLTWRLDGVLASGCNPAG